MPNAERPARFRLADVLAALLVAGGLAVIAVAGDTTRKDIPDATEDAETQANDNDVAQATIVRMTAGR